MTHATIADSLRQGLTASAGVALHGQVQAPGDKSISHRALILASLSVGETRIDGLLEGADVLATAKALDALGARLKRDSPGHWRVWGVGVGGFAEPEQVLDLGNAGTGVRLLMGAVASQAITAIFTGDASLCGRPMGRVLAPLRAMGAEAMTRRGDLLPIALRGGRLMPLIYRLPVPSAQVKSAVLLAGLGTLGTTTVVETAPSRDHTERMLGFFGAELRTERLDDGSVAISVDGCPELAATHIAVPGDPSSAAFPVVAGLIVPDSVVTVEGVGLNPLRAGLFTTLREMGAAITVTNERLAGAEPVADLLVRASSLSGVEVPAERAPSMIDEYPVLAVAAACARGRTVMHGLGELRVKESDRLNAMAEGLARCGIRAEIDGDSLAIEGAGDGAHVAGGAIVETQSDHRIAMAFLTLGLASKAPVGIDDGRMIATSFPDFVPLMRGLGARIAPAAAGP